VKVFLAQGFGVGRSPWAPGTFGSVIGLLWFAALLVPGNAWFFTLGAGAGIAGAVWLCGEAERILGRHDPRSVVLDEIVAIPLCFAAALVAHSTPPRLSQSATMPSRLALVVVPRGFCSLSVL
jgi:phosphatidylglycerophosphatase A